MAKTALLDVLEKTIGKYVVNLDAESLNVAVWSGKIKLNALQLDCAAVNAELSRQAAVGLSIPFQVLAGEFGSFEVDVPWTHLMSRPVILRASDLRVTVEPHNRSKSADFLAAFHDSEEERAAQVLKDRMKSLSVADDYRKQTNNLRDLTVQDFEKQSSENSGFVANLVRRIIENLQIEITNVHVEVQSNEYAAGLHIESLALATTDKEGHQTFIDRSKSSDALFKSLEIQGLCVYLDEKDRQKPTAFLQSIEEEIRDKELVEHSYVVVPMSFEAKLRQDDSNICVDFPKYLLESELSSLSFKLSKPQLELGRKIADQIRSDAATPLFPEYRPLKRISRDTATEWWKYAVRCVGRMNGQRSWAEFLAAFRLRQTYIPLYKRHTHHATCPWLEPLTTLETIQMEDIERERSISVDGVMTWRNMAEAQAGREGEKHAANKAKSKSESQGIFTSLFGAKKTVGDASKVDEDLPIALSTRELLELETMAMDAAENAELSSDSRLCDINFVMGALHIELSSYQERRLASLQLGTVSTSFKARKDGSYRFGLSLTSVDVKDLATTNTLFPTILRNQTDDETGEDSAFRVEISKSKKGDQKIAMKLNTFETVLVPNLIVEMQRMFVSSYKPTPSYSKSNANAFLAQSLSGSIDLFFDADGGPAMPLDAVQEEPTDAELAGPDTVDDLSKALIEAWKTKTESDVMWEVDLDLRAPIVVIPENALEPRSNVVVFDMGRTRFKYGNDIESPKVGEWFKSQPRDKSAGTEQHDNGFLGISSLTFTIGKAAFWRRIVRKQEGGATPSQSAEAIIEPLTVSLDFGIETSVGVVPRVCCFGVIPSIILRLSPGQLTRVLKVVNGFQRIVQQQSPFEDDLTPEHADDTDEKSASSAGSRMRRSAPSRLATKLSEALSKTAGAREEPLLQFFAGIDLKRLTVRAVSDAGHGIEAHLVSVSASTSSYSNSSSHSKLCMGWFWILDRCENSSPRKQRLVAHSTLPRPANDYAISNKYNVMDDLTEKGVFENNFTGAADLADVTLRRAAPGEFLHGVKNATGSMSQDWLATVSSVLDAKFTNLFVTWNPGGVSAILTLFQRFNASIESAKVQDQDALILSSPTQILRRRKYSSDSTNIQGKKRTASVRSSVLLINAAMDGLHLSLNSARDDLPLFLGTMSNTSVSVITHATDMELHLTLGDVRVATPPMGITIPEYRTVLGLASGKSDSLLSVSFYSGAGAVANVAVSGDQSLADHEAFAEIELSPMRVVYVQAQVLALVEYATAGILGSLTAQAASSAAKAAAELASPSTLKKLFRVKASGLELLFPQAAHCEKFLAASVASTSVDFTAFPDTSSHVAVVLGDMMISDDASKLLLSDPVQMSVVTVLPPLTTGTPHDQAISVGLEISKAHFILAKHHYAQILNSLDGNISDVDLYVRDGACLLGDYSEDTQETTFEDDSSSPTRITHGGVEFVENARRVYLDVKVHELVLTMCSAAVDSPIVRISAVNSEVSFRTFPDEENNRMTVRVTLLDLVCEDVRLKTAGRQYRTMIYQPEQAYDGDDKISAPGDVCDVFYESTSDGNSTVTLTIGSPRIVFIPDAVSDILDFVSVDRPTKQDADVYLDEVPEYHDIVAVNSCGDETGIEASVFTQPGNLNTLSFELKTANCSVLLVDLGSDALLTKKSGAIASSGVSETVVIGGVFQSKLILQSERGSGKAVNLNIELNVEELEVFTAFGLTLQGAVQILDPTQVSIYVSKRSDEGLRSILDIRCAVTVPIDVTISMRNFALINAIVTSFEDCFENDEHVSLDDAPFTEEDAKKVEVLDRALGDVDTESEHSASTRGLIKEESGIGQFGNTGHGEGDSADSSQVTVKITTPESKVTVVNDLQGLDEALIRITFRNFIANGHTEQNVRYKEGSLPFNSFDFSVHTSILADYFDASGYSWKTLLLQPWEISSKGTRGLNRRIQTERPSTTIDIESLPCHIAFSEQFLMNVASANRMWSIYTSASASALESLDDSASTSLQKSLAAGAARSFISSLPYAMENNSGVLIQFAVIGEKDQHRSCESGTIEYFRFEPPTCNGAGGKRLYGSDLSLEKRLMLTVGRDEIELLDLDGQLGHQSEAHRLSDGSVLVTKVVKETKTIVVHVTAGISIHNRSSLPFTVFASDDHGTEIDIGHCRGLGAGVVNTAEHSKITRDGKLSKLSHRFGLPLGVLRSFQKNWMAKRAAGISLSFSPMVENVHPGWILHGSLVVMVTSKDLDNHQPMRYDLTCRPRQRPDSSEAPPRDLHRFVARVTVGIQETEDNFPLVDIAIEPRALLTNKIPISICLKTPMPQVFRAATKSTSKQVEGNEFSLAFNEHVEVFTSGPSIAVLIKLADAPVSGTATDWVDGGWIDLPLVPEFRVLDPMLCRFPFTQRLTSESQNGSAKGSDFCIVEGTLGLSQLGSTTDDSKKSAPSESFTSSFREEDAGSFFITVRNYAIDHTGDILFEQMPKSSRSSETPNRMIQKYKRPPSSPPLGTYATDFHKGRISLLPNPEYSVRLLHLTMDGEDGLRRSSPFRVDDISVCNGGFNSTPVFWEDGTASGFFAYKQLVGSHQCEVHFVPEYIIFNGSETYCACVHLPNGDVLSIEPGSIAPLRTQDPNHTEIVVEYPELGGRTRPIRVDTHGLRMTVLRSMSGSPVGRFAVQTVVGARDSRWVAKLGEVKFGSLESPAASSSSSVLKNDFVRFRVKWSELQMTLSEARTGGMSEAARDHIQEVASPKNRHLSRAETWVEAREKRQKGMKDSFKFGEDHGRAVCTILLHRFTVDWQRVFKDDATIAKQAQGKEALESPQRAQLSIIVHNVRIKDESRHTPYPIVFDSSSETASFFDLCIRLRGDMDTTLMKIDLVDIKLAHVNRITEKIYISTTEDFIWSALDLADRIAAAAGEFSGVDMKLVWDDEHGGYNVAIQDAEISSLLDKETKYVPPKSDMIFHIQRARISPFTVVLSFKRSPQVSRYKKMAKGVRGSGLMNYFTRQLKFTIENAELRFAHYEVADVKGPPDRIIELISTVYLQRIKAKIITILTSASFQDWKYLTSRDDGNDEYLEGDLLRATGTLAGRSVNFVLKKAGTRVGGGLSSVAHTIGDGIESATDVMGVRVLGAGVNSLVSGVGDGVGDTISGVGTGAGKIMKGAGKGVGKVIGGFAGGATQMGKGIGKGIATGDGKAVSQGLMQGAQSIGTGVGQGVESVVMGASEGVLSVGQGLFSGVKNVGKGIGGAFTGKKTPRKPSGQH